MKSGMESSYCDVSMVNIHLRKLMWIYCPKHAGEKRNDWELQTTLTSSLRVERSEVLRSLRHYMRAQSQGHHIIDCLEERGVKRGSARRSSLKRQERAIVSQTNIGTVSKAMLRNPLRDGVECIWAFPSAETWSRIELNVCLSYLGLLL